MKPTTSPYIVVRRSKIHNKGVFAKKDVRKNTKILEYVGEKITSAESERRSDITFEKAKKTKSKGAIYTFELTKKYDIDGDVPYNTAKWINHSCDPNCDVEITKGHIWIVALRKIKKGEEFSYNYGFDVDDYADYPCKCGASKCVGYIIDEDDWGKLKRRIARKKKK